MQMIYEEDLQCIRYDDTNKYMNAQSDWFNDVHLWYSN